jgi:hypothetical protein
MSEWSKLLARLLGSTCDRSYCFEESMRADNGSHMIDLVCMCDREDIAQQELIKRSLIVL